MKYYKNFIKEIAKRIGYEDRKSAFHIYTSEYTIFKNGRDWQFYRNHIKDYFQSYKCDFLILIIVELKHLFTHDFLLRRFAIFSYTLKVYTHYSNMFLTSFDRFSSTSSDWKKTLFTVASIIFWSHLVWASNAFYERTASHFKI